MRKPRLTTLQKKAQGKGYSTLLLPDTLRVSPRSGKILHTRNRRTLYIYSDHGDPILEHTTRLTKTTNQDVEGQIDQLETL